MARLGPGGTARLAADHRQRASRSQAGTAKEQSHLAAAARLEEQLRLDGRCVRCGRPIRNDKSVTDGIGPDCRQKTT